MMFYFVDLVAGEILVTHLSRFHIYISLHLFLCYMYLCQIKAYRVHCFLMQFVINKCFLPNPEKNLAQIRHVVFEKNAKNAHLIRKMASPRRRLEGLADGCSNNQLKSY